MTTSKSSDKGYTVAEAAERLGVPKKNLRHALARPDRKARLLREYRNSKKGLVSVEIVPVDLFLEIEHAAAQFAAFVSPDSVETGTELDDEPIAIPVSYGDEPMPEPDDAAALDLERVLGAGVVAAVEQPAEFADVSMDEVAAVVDAVVSEPSSAPVAESAIEPTDTGEVAMEAEAAIEHTEVAVQSEPATEVALQTETVRELRPAQQASAADTLLVVATYERLLAEKEGRLADLRNALESERENSRRLADALAREQALRAEPKADAARRGWWARLFGG